MGQKDLTVSCNWIRTRDRGARPVTRHKDAGYSGCEIHVCSCGRTYKHKKHLRSHQKFECGIEPQFECRLCGRRFKQKGNLKYHMVAVHIAKKM